MLTEKEAWLAIAEEFDTGNTPSNYGVCNAVYVLYCDGDITVSTYDNMLDKVKAYSKHTIKQYGAAHLWSFKPSGCKARARFCRRQAENA